MTNPYIGPTLFDDGKPIPLTPLGELLRRIRLEQSIKFEDFAAGIGAAPYFLCDVEHGRRKVPDGFVEACVAYLNLDDDRAEVLKRRSRAKR